jgi:hypothetical protein
VSENDNKKPIDPRDAASENDGVQDPSKPHSSAGATGKPNIFKQKRYIVAAVIILAAATLSVVRSSSSGVRKLDVDGTITYIDLSSRSAGLEYVSPRNGQLREIAGKIPEDCDILLNGSPAALDDLRVGDRASIKVLWDTEKAQLQAVAVSVTRKATE